MFGERIKSLRIERGVGISTLAETLGISEFELAAMEQGKMEIAAEHVVDICQALDVSFVEFISGI